MIIYSTDSKNIKEDLQLLQSVANQTAVALENARLYANSEKKIQELSVLNNVARVVNSTLDLDQLLEISVLPHGNYPCFCRHSSNLLRQTWIFSFQKAHRFYRRLK